MTNNNKIVSNDKEVEIIFATSLDELTIFEIEMKGYIGNVRIHHITNKSLNVVVEIYDIARFKQEIKGDVMEKKFSSIDKTIVLETITLENLEFLANNYFYIN